MDKNLRVRLTLDAVDKMARPLRGIDQAADKVTKTLRAVNDRARALKGTLSDVEGYRASERAISLNNTALDKARQKADAFAAEWHAADAPTQQLTRSFAAASQEVARLEALQDRHKATLQAVSQRLQAAGVSTDDMVRHEQRLQGELRETNSELERHRAELGRVNDQRRRMEQIRGRYDNTMARAGQVQGAGMSALGAGAVVAAPIAVGVRAAADTQAGVTTIAQRSDMSPAAAQAFQTRMMAMARRNNQTRQEALDLLDELTAQGNDPTRALEMSDAVARATVAYRENSREMGQAAGSLRNLQIEAAGTSRAFDIMASAGKRGNWEFGAMARAFPQLTASAAAHGMTGDRGVAELAAAGQIVRRGAGSDDEAATNLNNIMQKIGSPQTARRFAAVGINLRQELERGKAAGVTALETIIELTKRATGGDATLLGNFFEDAQVQAGMRPLMAATDEFRSIRDEALRSNGVVDRDFATRMEDANEAAKKLRIAADTAGVTIGGMLLPTLVKAARAGAEVADRFNGWAQANPAVARTLAIIAVAVATGLVLFGGLALAVSAVLMPFAMLQFALANTTTLLGPLGRGFMMGARGALWMGTALRANLVPSLVAAGRGFMLMGGAVARAGLLMLANPLTWIILAIVAAVALLAGAAYLIYRNWGTIGPWLGNLWAGIRRTVGGALSAIGGAVMRWTPLGAIVRNWSGITGFLGGLWTLISQSVLLGLDLIKLGILKFTPLGMIIRNWGPITSFITGVWNGIKSGVSTAIATVLSYVMNFTPLGAIVRNWGAITGFIGRVWDRLKTSVSTGIAAIGTAISGWGPLQSFKDAFQSTFDWLANLPARFLQSGTDMVQGMINGIRGQRANVAAAAADATRGTHTASQRAAEINSPSRLFARLGKGLMSGLTLGIDRNAEAPAYRMRRATLGLASAAAVGLAPIAVQAATVPGYAPAAVSPATAPRPRFDVVTPVVGAPRRSAAGADDGFLSGLMLRTATAFPIAQALSFAVPAIEQARPTFDSGPRIRPPAEIASRAPEGGPADRGPRPAPVFNITINAAPGQDPRSIVDELQDRVQNAGGSGNGLYGDDVYGAG